MPHSANPDQLQVWVEAFPREETETRIQELERELNRLRSALALHDSFRASNGTATDSAEASPPEPSGDVPENRPQAIRRVLRENNNQPMTPAQIRETLISKGWLKKDPKNLKRFYAAMSTMTARGHLLRLHDGRYVLPGGPAMS